MGCAKFWWCVWKVQTMSSNCTWLKTDLLTCWWAWYVFVDIKACPYRQLAVVYIVVHCRHGTRVSFGKASPGKHVSTQHLVSMTTKCDGAHGCGCKLHLIDREVGAKIMAKFSSATVYPNPYLHNLVSSVFSLKLKLNDLFCTERRHFGSF